jgi:hypothetical protein
MEQKLDLFYRINRLPECLVREIYDFIPRSVSLWLNRENYYKNHELVKRMITIDYETYVRNVIKNDYSILFELILRENLNSWFVERKYYFKKSTYSSYLSFLFDYSVENESTK